MNTLISSEELLRLKNSRVKIVPKLYQMKLSLWLTKLKYLLWILHEYMSIKWAPTLFPFEI